MNIETKKQDDIDLITISGRLDATTAADAEQTMNSIITTDGIKLLVNLKNLEYISSAGLRVLLLAAKKVASKSGKVCISSLTGNVKDVFEISGFTSVFNIKNSEAEAIDSLNS